MILVDTSVWVGHFRAAIRRRREVLDHLGHLPCSTLPEHGEVLRFVEEERLWGTGLGWVDVHILASAVRRGVRDFLRPAVVTPW